LLFDPMILTPLSATSDELGERPEMVATVASACEPLPVV